MSENVLNEKIVVVTGAAGLIGKGICEEIVGSGGVVLIADNNSEGGKRLEEELNAAFGDGKAKFVYTDITDKSSIEELIKLAESEYGKIDALVNNAYPRNKDYGADFEKVSYDSFCENINMHLGGYFLMTQQVASKMKEQGYGNIINMASIYGFAAPKFEIYEGTGMTVPVEYAAIKGGVINLSRYLASYLGKDNIRVNCISPGGVFNDQPESFVKKYMEKVMIGSRMANAEDLSKLAVFLLSDNSSYITGQNIVVDGGWSLNS